MAIDETLVSRLRESLQREPDVVFAYLFGSQGRGDAGARSDVDVAIFLDAGSRLGVLDVMAQIEGEGRRHLDVVILNTAPLTLAYETLKGLLLFSRDEEARIAFETALTHRYLDRVGYMRRHLEAFADDLREGGFS